MNNISCLILPYINVLRSIFIVRIKPIIRNGLTSKFAETAELSRISLR